MGNESQQPAAVNVATLSFIPGLCLRMPQVMYKVYLIHWEHLLLYYFILLRPPRIVCQERRNEHK